MCSLIEVLVREMTKDAGPSHVLLWRSAVERAGSLGLEDSALRTLVEAAGSPRALSSVAELVGRADKGVEALARAADDAAGGLGAVVRGLAVLLGYLREQGRVTQLGVALGYLACCEEAPGMGGGLADSVRGHLYDHGFDG